MGRHQEELLVAAEQKGKEEFSRGYAYLELNH